MKTMTAPMGSLLWVAVIIMLCAMATRAWADDEGEHHHFHHSHMMETDDPHAHHHHMAKDEVKRSVTSYELPGIMLVRDDGKSVSLPEELNDGRPVILNFIFTSCTAVCPVSSRIFSVFQDSLGSDRDKVHMASISIDPEQDTPAALKKYAGKYGAGPQWHFYTGTVEASIAAQRAFDVYRGDKMNHTPVTLLRAAPGQPWLRIDGFASADELLRDYRTMIALK